jgi:hypothetical protein
VGVALRRNTLVTVFGFRFRYRVLQLLEIAGNSDVPQKMGHGCFTALGFSLSLTAHSTDFGALSSAAPSGERAPSRTMDSRGTLLSLLCVSYTQSYRRPEA